MLDIILNSAIIVADIIPVSYTHLGAQRGGFFIYPKERE